MPFIILISGCGLLLPFYGVKKAKYESLPFQRHYLKGLGVDTSNLYQLKCNYRDSLSNIKYAINLYKVKHGGHASPVQFRLYDSTGKFITGWEQCFGNAKKLGYFDTIPMHISYKVYPKVINFNLSFYTDLKLFDIKEKEKQIILSNIHKYDYTIIIFWASWAGTFNKRNFENVYNYIRKYKNKKFYLLKLNVASCKKNHSR